MGEGGGCCKKGGIGRDSWKGRLGGVEVWLIRRERRSGWKGGWKVGGGWAGDGERELTGRGQMGEGMEVARRGGRVAGKEGGEGGVRG